MKMCVFGKFVHNCVIKYGDNVMDEHGKKMIAPIVITILMIAYGTAVKFVNS